MKTKKITLFILFFIVFILSLSDQGNILPYFLILQTPFLLYSLFNKPKINKFVPNEIKVPLGTVWLLFFTFLIINVIFSVDKEASFEILLIYLSSWLVFILGYNLDLKPKLKEFGLKLFLLISFLLTLPYLWFRFQPLVRAGFSALTMIYPITGHVHLSSVILLALVASVFLRKYILAIWFFICLVLTNSVSSFLALVIISLYLSLIYRKTLIIGSKKVLRILALSSLIVLISFLFISYFQPSFISRLDPTWERKTLFGSRHHYWAQGIKGFLEKPFLGSGVETFGFISKKFQPDPFLYSLYAHNFYLQWLVETGVVGTIILVFVAWKTIKHLDLKSEENQLISLIVLTSSVESFSDYGWQFPSILFLLAFWTGGILKRDIKTTSLSKQTLIFLSLVLIIISACQIFSRYFYHQRKYHLSLILNPLQQGGYIENFDRYPFWLTNYLFKGNPKFWEKLSRKYEAEENLKKAAWAKEQEVRLLSPGGYPTTYLKLASFYSRLNENSQLIKTIIKIIRPIFKNNEEINLRLDNLSQHPPPEVISFTRKLVNKENNYPNSFKTKFIYQLGLFYFHKDQPEITKILWHKLTIINDEWSDFHIELANLYYYLNNKEKAIYQLDNICKSKHYPKEHCSIYLEKYRDRGFQLPGSQEKDIEKKFRNL